MADAPDNPQPVERTDEHGRTYLEVRNPVNGQFLPGHKPPGKTKGAVNGIKQLRAMIDGLAKEMSEPGADIDQMVAELRSQGTKGRWFILKEILFKAMDLDARKKEDDDDLADAEPIVIQMVLEDKPRHVESRTVETNGTNGKANDV